MQRLHISICSGICHVHFANRYTDSTSVRFVDAAPRYETVKLCVNSVELGRGTFSPDVASLVTPLSAISQKMVVTATNDSTVLAYTPVKFVGDTSYTVVFTQHGSKGGLLVLHDTVASTPPTGQASFRFVNVAPGASAMDVYKTTGSATLTGMTPWASNLSFEKSSSYVSVPVGSYRIIVTAVGHPDSVLYDSKTRQPCNWWAGVDGSLHEELWMWRFCKYNDAFDDDVCQGPRLADWAAGTWGQPRRLSPPQS